VRWETWILHGASFSPKESYEQIDVEIKNAKLYVAANLYWWNIFAAHHKKEITTRENDWA
jgi:hypothetical protein